MVPIGGRARAAPDPRDAARGAAWRLSMTDRLDRDDATRYDMDVVVLGT
jgi:hypothetical protein